MKSLLSFILVLSTSHLLLAQTSLYVGSGQDDGITFFDDFAPAANAANNGDTIFIYPGWYDPASFLIINKSLILIGPGYDQVVNDPQISTLISSARIPRLWVEDVDYFICQGIELHACTFKDIDNLLIIRSKVAGFRLYDCSYAAIQGCFVWQGATQPSEGAYSSTAYGIYHSGCSRVDVLNNIIGHSGNGNVNYWGDISTNSSLIKNNTFYELGTSFYSNGVSVAINNISIGDDGPANPTRNPRMSRVNNFNVSTITNLDSNSVNQVFGFGASEIFTPNVIDSTFQILTGSYLKTICGGSECGAFGDNDPYTLSGLPALPFVRSLESNRFGSVQSGIPVTISVKAID